MQFPSKEKLADRKALYLGKTIELLAMSDDPNPIEVGTKGTVHYVDDAGSLLVNWENGRNLNVCLDDGDQVRIL